MALLAMSAAMFAPAIVSAQTIVVRSDGPSAAAYPAGKRIADGGQLALKRGDSVTILGEKGTREFKGPGAFRIDAATVTAGRLGKALANSGSRQARTGAVRGGGRWDRPSNPWMLEADKSGTVCFSQARMVELWLPQINFAYSMKLTRLNDNKGVPLALNPGQRIASWPAAQLPPMAGERIRVDTVSSDSAATIEFADIGPAPASRVDLAEAFIRKGCRAQLDVLLNSAGTPELDEIREEQAAKASMP